MDLLLAIRREIEWAKEGAPRPEGDPYVSWGAFPDWSGSNHLSFDGAFADTAAVIVDGELFFDGELRQLEVAGYLPDRNPHYVAFRVVDQKTGQRQSLVVLREDVAPSADAVRNAVGSAIYDPESARVRAAAHTANAASSQSTRSRGGID